MEYEWLSSALHNCNCHATINFSSSGNRQSYILFNAWCRKPNSLLNQRIICNLRQVIARRTNTHINRITKRGKFLEKTHKYLTSGFFDQWATIFELAIKWVSHQWAAKFDDAQTCKDWGQVVVLGKWLFDKCTTQINKITRDWRRHKR